jgi:origin recognition complex subunit 5
MGAARVFFPRSHLLQARLHVPSIMTAPTLDAVLAAHPTHRALLSILSTLLPAAAPPFLYIHDPHTPRLAGCAVRELLASLSASDDAFRATTLDGVACFTPKLLFTRTLDALARHVPMWPDCRSWTGPGGERYDESLDSFLHGLRALESQVRADNPGADVRMVLFVDHAERVLPELLVPLARLAELVRLRVDLVKSG